MSEKPTNTIVESEINTDDPSHPSHLLLLEQHMKDGHIPSGTTLHVAAQKALAEAGVQVEDEVVEQKSIEQIYDIIRERRKGKLNNLDAKCLINNGHVSNVLFYINSFQDLDSEVALKLLDIDDGNRINKSDLKVVENLDKFQGLDSEVAHKLVDAGWATSISNNINSFQGLDSEVALKLVNTEYISNNFARNLDKFQGLDKNLVLKIAETWGLSVLNQLDNYPEVSHQEVAEKIIESKMCGTHALFSTDRDLKLSNEVKGKIDFDALKPYIARDAQRMIDKGRIDLVLLWVEDYKNAINLSELTQEFFKQHPNSAGLFLMDYDDGHDHYSFKGYRIDNFESFDYEKSRKIIEAAKTKFSDWQQFIARRIDKFQGLGSKDYDELLDGDNGDIADILLEAIINKTITKDVFNILLKCSTVYGTAQKIKKNVDLHSFGFSEEQIEQIQSAVDSTPRPEIEDQIADQNKYQEADKYAEGGPRSVKLTREVSKALREAGENDPNLIAINLQLQKAHEDLKVKTIKLLGEDKAAIIFSEDGEFSQEQLAHRYKLLVSKFIAQESSNAVSIENIDLEEMLPKIEESLKFANKKFIQVLKVDVPYYDKLFLEWDAKRLGEKEFTEVFLGRDGIYAFIGRQAQINARRKLLGLESSKEEAIDKPLYLVYPRVFRDSLSYEAKEQYIEEKLADKANSASYYDTGYSGSIPEDIMRVLGITPEEMDKHIRLLSAEKRDRTVIGLSGSQDERKDIVDKVEYNVKSEETAEGLYARQPINPNLGDEPRLEHYAKPTTPTGQLAFAMVEQALKRYYYSQEMQNFKQEFQTSKLDNGFEARIKTTEDDATKVLITTLFSSSSIGDELKNRATALKIANPEDPYPDEAVFEVDNVIIKQFVASKQQGVIDEFEALVILDKVGIDAPKPVARIFSGTDQSGFVVMEKLSGASGRMIEKHIPTDLIESFNDQALARMQDIAEAVRRDAGIDKPWRLKDFMLDYEISEDGKSITINSMKPIDFERAKIFDPQNPHSIKIK